LVFHGLQNSAMAGDDARRFAASVTRRLTPKRLHDG
jgi:hypothetical protein